MTLAGWIGRATAAFRRSTTPEPQPFQLPCDCGEAISGWRTETHQRISCPACRQTHLVMPGNVYPAVRRAVAKTVPKKAPKDIQPDPPSTKIKPVDRTSARRREEPRPEPEASSVTSSESAPTAATEPAIQRIDLSPTMQQGQKRRLRLRLIILSITALFAVTGWSLWNRARREHARVTIPIASKAGIEALRAGDFVTARRELTAAVQGLDILRWNDAAALAIRQGHREAVAGEGLMAKDFVTIAEEVLTGAGSEEERQRRFRSESGRKWLLFDVDLTQGSTSEYELDVPLAVQDRVLQVACDAAAIKQMTSGQAARVIFAAQIEEWRFPASVTEPLIARLDNSTAFLWTDYEAYVAAGYKADSIEAEAETRGVLNTQRQLVSP